MKHLSQISGHVTKQFFEKKYILLGRIVEQWEDIIGASLAQKAVPVKIRYRKTPKSKKPEAFLDVAASSADSTMLHYQKDLICERINQIFGEPLIKGVRFVTVASNINALRPQPKAKKPKPLPPEALAKLGESLQVIDDPDIKARLQRLGQAIYSS